MELVTGEETRKVLVGPDPPTPEHKTTSTFLHPLQLLKRLWNNLKKLGKKQKDISEEEDGRDDTSLTGDLPMDLEAATHSINYGTNENDNNNNNSNNNNNNKNNKNGLKLIGLPETGKLLKQSRVSPLNEKPHPPWAWQFAVLLHRSGKRSRKRILSTLPLLQVSTYKRCMYVCGT